MKETAKIIQPTELRHDTHADLNQTSKIGMGMVISFAGLVGAWSLACFLGALGTQGIGTAIKGFMTAVTGM